MYLKWLDFSDFLRDYINLLWGSLPVEMGGVPMDLRGVVFIWAGHVLILFD